MTIKHQETSRQFSGRHFLIVVIGAFAIILAANLTLAVFAVGSFPGLEVKNTYVASQTYDSRRDAQRALGWKVAINHHNDVLELIVIDDHGQPVIPASVSMSIGAAATARLDRDLVLHRRGEGFFTKATLAPGNHLIHIDAIAKDGTIFTQRHRLVTR
jgi:nitrogen fixation protein FixH